MLGGGGALSKFLNDPGPPAYLTDTICPVRELQLPVVKHDPAILQEACSLAMVRLVFLPGHFRR